MSIRFILAPAGGGKTHFCINEIANLSLDEPLGKAIYFILPEQATFIHERLLCETSQGGGFCRANICSFNRLIQYMYKDNALAPAPQLSEAGKLLLAGRVISEARKQLKVYAKSAASPGFASYLVKAAEELAVYSINPDNLDQALVRFTKDNGESRQIERLRETALLYRLYQQAQSENFSSYAENMSLLAKSIDEGFLNESDIYIDGYADFTPAQYLVIEKLMSRDKGRVSIALPIDPNLLESENSNKHIFRTPLHTWSKLSQIADKLKVKIEEPLLLDGQKGRFAANSELAALEAVISGRKPDLQYSEELKNISLHQAPNRHAELAGIGREIIRLTREEGLRYRDISLITRDSAPYEQLIAEVFSDMGIPYFIDTKKTLLCHPLFELIGAALENWAYKPSYERVMRFCKNSLLPTTKDETDRLDNYALAHGLRFWHWQSNKPWDFACLSGEDEELSAKAEEIRQKASSALMYFIQTIPQNTNAKELNQGLIKMLEELDIANALQDLAANALQDSSAEVSAQHQQAWDKLNSFFEEASELLKDEEFSATDLLKLYDAALKGITVSTIPPGLDQVFVASLERSRSPELKASFVMSLNDQIIPQRIIADGLFSDADRKSLSMCGAKLAPDTLSRQFLEDYLSYIVLTRSAGKLNLSYINQNEQGKEMRPSPLIRQLKAAFPLLKTESFEPIQANQLIGGSLDMAQMAVQLQKNKHKHIDDSFWPSVYSYYANDSRYQKELEQLQKGLNYQPLNSPLPKAIRNKLYGDNLRGSVSRFEKYRLCPFAYFANYGLKLQKRPEYQLDAAVKGQLYHEVLAQIGNQILENNLSWQDIDENIAQQLVEDALEKQLSDLLDGILHSSARYKYLSNRIKDALVGAVLFLAEHAKRGEFVPVAWELPFGSSEENSLPAFKIDLPGGQVLELSGRIDRVDMAINETQENSYFRIIDYKSGKPSLNIEDIANGLRIQLLSYLQVVMMNSDIFSDRPAKTGGIYYANVSDTLSIGRGDKKDSPAGLKLMGLTMRDQEAILLADKDINGVSDLIPIRMGNNGIAARPAGLSNEQLNQLQDRLVEILSQTAIEILEGVISVSPLRDKDFDACAYCDYASVCGFDQKLSKPRMKEYIFDEQVPDLDEQGGDK